MLICFGNTVPNSIMPSPFNWNERTAEHLLVVITEAWTSKYQEYFLLGTFYKHCVELDHSWLWLIMSPDILILLSNLQAWKEWSLAQRFKARTSINMQYIKYRSAMGIWYHRSKTYHIGQLQESEHESSKRWYLPLSKVSKNDPQVAGLHNRHTRGPSQHTQPQHPVCLCESHVLKDILESCSPTVKLHVQRGLKLECHCRVYCNVQLVLLKFLKHPAGHTVFCFDMWQIYYVKVLFQKVFHLFTVDKSSCNTVWLQKVIRSYYEDNRLG